MEKLAISTENGQVADHFGRCSKFTIVEIKQGKIIDQQTIPNPGHKPGFLPQYLSEMGVNCIIAGGMGQRAKQLFDERQIKTIVGVEGDIQSVLDNYMSRNLSSDNSYCEH